MRSFPFTLVPTSERLINGVSFAFQGVRSDPTLTTDAAQARTTGPTDLPTAIRTARREATTATTEGAETGTVGEEAGTAEETGTSPGTAGGTTGTRGLRTSECALHSFFIVLLLVSSLTLLSVRAISDYRGPSSSSRRYDDRELVLPLLRPPILQRI